MTTLLYIEFSLLFLLLIAFFRLKNFFKWIIKVFGYKWFYWNIYLRMPSWKFARFLKRLFSAGRCSKCHRYGALDCHHVSYKHPWYEWLHLNDIALVCRKCHHEEHPNYARSEWQRAWSK